MPLVDMDPTIVDQLKGRYPDYAVILVHDYEYERRIQLEPGGGRHLFQIEVDVPPGCYVVWARACYGGNEETNKVMVLVRCGDEACVNLLLNDVKTCAREIMYPLLEHGALIGMEKPDLEAVARVLMKVGEMPQKQVLAELDERLAHAVHRDPRLRKVTGSVIAMLKAKSD
jgi:hypothetical protein